MTKTRSGDEDDNVCVEHSSEEKVNAMFANLGEVYGNKPKSLAHLMFNT